MFECWLADPFLYVISRGVRLAKMTSVQFCKKNCGFWFGYSFTKLAVVLFIFLPVQFLHSSVTAFFHLYLCGMMLEIMYFHAELVQLIVSRSDSELEVQRYGAKKNTLTVDPIMLEDKNVNEAA